MKREIFLSTFSYQATKEIAEYGIGIEYNQFCISQWLDDEVIEDTLARMRKQALRCGIGIQDSSESVKVIDTGSRPQLKDPAEEGLDPDPAKAIIHGPFSEIAPAAFDHRFRELARDRLEQAAAGAKRLGLNRMVVHTGYIPIIFDPGWHVKESIGFWTDFLKDKDDDFQLYLENVMDETPDLLLDIIKGVDDPRMNICLDVGHVNVVSDIKATEWIEKLGGYIHHFHLHNNDGKGDQHAPLTEGELNMEEIMRAIDACCPEDATLTIESRKCHESIGWLIDRI